MKVTFEAKVIAEIDSQNISLMDIKDLLDFGKYETELIIPIMNDGPTIVIKQKS